MANLKAVRVGRTVNTGNYESRRVDVELEALPGDTLDELVADAEALLDYIQAGPDTRTTEVRAAKRVVGAHKRVKRYNLGDY